MLTALSSQLQARVRTAAPMVWVASVLGGALGTATVSGCASTPASTSRRAVAPLDERQDEVLTPQAEGAPLVHDDAEEEPHPSASCKDGGCFSCATTRCLAGFYCDENMASCGWLPQCAINPTCECLLEYLPSCSCEMRAGAAFLSCN